MNKWDLIVPSLLILLLISIVLWMRITDHQIDRLEKYQDKIDSRLETLERKAHINRVYYAEK